MLRNLRLLGFFIVLLGVAIHGSMLVSLVAEPFEWLPGHNMTGTLSHPQEDTTLRGFWDPFFHDSDRVPRGLDFFSIYQAGYYFSIGQPIYYGVRESTLGNETLVVPYFSGFRYLPVYAYTFGYLLTILSPWTSYWIWIGCVELLFGFNLLLLCRTDNPLHLKIIAAFMWLAYSPYFIELHIGQQSMVTVTLLHVMILRNANQKLRDTSYILSVLWKINTLLFLPVWIRLRRYGTIIILVSSIILVSAPYFIRFPDTLKEFLSYFGSKFIATGPNSFGVWSLVASVWHTCSFDSSILPYLLKIWTVVVLMIAASATFFSKHFCFEKALCMWSCSYFLTYQYVWEHHYVLLMPVFSSLLFKDKSLRWTIPWVFCALPTPYYFLNIPTLSMPQSQWTIIELLFHHSTKIIPVIVTFGLLAYHLLFTRSEME